MAQSPVRLVHDWTELADQTGGPIGPATAPDALLFQAAGSSLITRPDSYPLTLADFNAVQGGISVKCSGQGTHAVLRLSGLVPFGLYSLQLVLMSAMGSPVGVGSLDDDPNKSFFRADADGEGDVSVTHKAGPLSVQGDVSGCWLADSLNMVMQQPLSQVAGYYHFGGEGTGPSGASVRQFAFNFLRLMRLPNEIRDSKGNPITESTPPDTPLFEFRKGNPVYAPGTGKTRPVLTLAEYSQACGSIAVKCTSDGTYTATQLTGLVPFGVYTIWLAKPDPTDMTTMLGVGALGKGDGSENHFVADQNGEADISAVTPGGKLSTFGSIAQCWPTDEPVVQVAGVYHIDGKTNGPQIGPDGTYAAQFAFVFAKPPQGGPKK